MSIVGSAGGVKVVECEGELLKVEFDTKEGVGVED